MGEEGLGESGGKSAEEGCSLNESEKSECQ